MTIAQFIVAYSVCWWLVLFMVLPHQADAEKAPETGHAPSAPANPQIKKKCLWATFLAIIPTALIYFAASNVRAEETIYHVGGGCEPYANYVPSADVNARDGFGLGETKVKPANLDDNAGLIDLDTIDIPLRIPSQNYIDRAAQASNPQNTATSINGRNVDLSESFIRAGALSVKREGSILLNGKSISNNQLTRDGCNEKAK
jgi:predicted secreted protein